MDDLRTGVAVGAKGDVVSDHGEARGQAVCRRCIVEARNDLESLCEIPHTTHRVHDDGLAGGVWRVALHAEAEVGIRDLIESLESDRE